MPIASRQNGGIDGRGVSCLRECCCVERSGGAILDFG